MNDREHKWHSRFLKLAKEVASWSIDPSTKVGCVLVKEKRVISTVHAEVNAVTTAALHGVSTEGASAYITLMPCSRCASVLINAGVNAVYVAGGTTIPDRWLKNFILASKLLAEAGITYEVIDLTP
jgi:dCMP deaminase